MQTWHTPGIDYTQQRWQDLGFGMSRPCVKRGIFDHVLGPILMRKYG